MLIGRRSELTMKPPIRVHSALLSAVTAEGHSVAVNKSKIQQKIWNFILEKCFTLLKGNKGESDSIISENSPTRKVTKPVIS